MKKLLLIIALLCTASRARAQTSATLNTVSTGSCTPTSCLTYNVPSGIGAIGLSVTGTSGTVEFDVVDVNGNYAAVNVTPSNSTTAVTSVSVSGAQFFQLNPAGFSGVRVRLTAAGSAVVTINPSTASARAGGGGGGGGSGTVTSIATTSPVTGGTITTTGTIACATCVTSAASLTSGQFMEGAGSQASATTSHLDDGVTTAATITSTEPIAAPSFSTSSGSAAGYFQCTQGTANGHATANTITLECPASVTAYEEVKPGAAATGIYHAANSSNVVTESISAVVSADLNITTTACTNQFLTAISATGTGTCTTATLAGAQFANQGTTTTVLHGNGSGNPAFGAVVGADMTNATVTATQLAAQYSKGSCTEVWGGSGTSFAMTSGDDAISNNSCYNDSGVTRTITALKCRSDNAVNTTILTPTFGSAGTGTAILTGTVTCGNSYAYSATGTLNNTAWTTGAGIDPGMSTVGNATSIAMIVEYTY